MVRGRQPIRVECAPAFHYALAEHRTSLIPDDTIPENGENASDKQKKAVFESDELTLDLRFVAESVIDGVPSPSVDMHTLDLRPRGHKGISICVDLDLTEGQVVTFVLRTPSKAASEQNNSDSTKELGDREFWLWLYHFYAPTLEWQNRRAKKIHCLPRYPPFSVYLMYCSRFQRIFFAICSEAPMNTGMLGSGGLPTMAPGKKLSIAVRSR